jgi:hypothetical protein
VHYQSEWSARLARLVAAAAPGEAPADMLQAHAANTLMYRVRRGAREPVAELR